MKNIITHSAGELTLHPLLESIPMTPQNSAEWAALVLDIQERGIDQPIIIDEQNRIMDGRHRWRAAEQCGEKIPCIVQSSDNAADIILHSLVDRRHMTKGCQAYVSYPVIASLIPDKNKNLRKGNSPKPIESVSGKSRDEICASLGFSPDTLEQARQLHEVFSKRPDLREKFEPKILSGEAGLGGVLAGIAGKEATEKMPRKDRPDFELIGEAVKQLELRFDYWSRLEASKRKQISNRVVESVLCWPEDLRADVQSALTAAAKGRK